MTIRGCAYAGSKGVVWGPIKDMVHVSPRPGRLRPVLLGAPAATTMIGTNGVNTFGTMHFTSDFQEKDIVFGGDKKLPSHRRGQCALPARQGHLGPVGVSDRPDRRRHRGRLQEKTKELDKPIVPVRCEGFRGVSQSLGHHIANDSIRDHVLRQDRRT